MNIQQYTQAVRDILSQALSERQLGVVLTHHNILAYYEDNTPPSEAAYEIVQDNLGLLLEDTL